jgi:hypothetical protein
MLPEVENSSSSSLSVQLSLRPHWVIGIDKEAVSSELLGTSVAQADDNPAFRESAPFMAPKSASVLSLPLELQSLYLSNAAMHPYMEGAAANAAKDLARVSSESHVLPLVEVPTVAMDVG